MLLQSRIGKALSRFLVSDNGSTFGTQALIQRYAERFPYLVSVDSSDVPGVSHARNVGASAATSDYLLFCDQDDKVGVGWPHSRHSLKSRTLVSPAAQNRDAPASASGLRENTLYSSVDDAGRVDATCEAFSASLCASPFDPCAPGGLVPVLASEGGNPPPRASSLCRVERRPATIP
jgi:hypothetical protein